MIIFAIKDNYHNRFPQNIHNNASVYHLFCSPKEVLIRLPQLQHYQWSLWCNSVAW